MRYPTLKVMSMMAGLAFAVPAAAQYQVRLQQGQYGTTPGGVFQISSVAGRSFVATPDGDPFDTFCIETTEYLIPEYYQSAVYDAQVSKAGIYNNLGPGFANPLEPETAYLYSLWLGYDGGLVHNDTNADQLQRAIWYLEGQPVYGQYNPLVARAQDAVRPGGANDSWYDIYGTTIGNVRVLNLFAPDRAGQYEARRQDMLVRTVESQPLTPGYWKNHPQAWPVDTMEIGDVVYDFDQLMSLLNTRTPEGRKAANDMSIKLAKFLVATRLSLMAGSDPMDIVPVALEADQFLEQHGLGFRPRGALYEQSASLKDLLDGYLNGDTDQQFPTEMMTTDVTADLAGMDDLLAKAGKGKKNGRSLPAVPLVVEVPEPATWLVMVLAGLPVLRRSRRDRC